MIYTQPLLAYRFNLKSKKLEGLARLAKVGVPTVSNLFIVLPKLYFEFQKTNQLPPDAVEELKTVFNSIRKQRNSITLRNSIYERGNSGIAFSVPNSLNIRDFREFLKKIVLGFRKAKRMAIDPEKVEFCFLIQSFYSSEKCGILLSENGKNQIYLQAILGQHTKLLLRGDITPDEYTIDKKTYKISLKKIAIKNFRIKKLASGIEKIRVEKADRHKSVLTDEQVIKIAKLSQVVERVFGPQEIEWAVLDSGKIIFQETRDFKQAKTVKFLKVGEVIFPAETEGEIVNLQKLPEKESVSEKIIVTNNLNIAFINKLAFLHRPRAVILTRGSLTSHVATILRESKITTLLVKDAAFKDGEKISIEKDGRIQRMS